MFAFTGCARLRFANINGYWHSRYGLVKPACAFRRFPGPPQNEPVAPFARDRLPDWFAGAAFVPSGAREEVLTNNQIPVGSTACKALSNTLWPRPIGRWSCPRVGRGCPAGGANVWRLGWLDSSWSVELLDSAANFRNLPSTECPLLDQYRIAVAVGCLILDTAE